MLIQSSTIILKKTHAYFSVFQMAKYASLINQVL